MSDATTGVAHANARVSTIPKLSCPIDGAASAFARSSSAVRSSCEMKPSTSMPSVGMRCRASRSPTASGSAPTSRSRAPVRRWISGHARSSTGMPLRGSCRPMKTIVLSRSSGSAAGGISVPFGITSKSQSLSQFCAESRACSETAIRWSIRSSRTPHIGRPRRIQPSAPAACQVATIAQRATASVETQIAGVIGSCRCSTSNCSSRTRA